MNNSYSDAMISISLERQAEMVSQVQAYDGQHPQPAAGRLGLLVMIVMAVALLLVIAVR